MKATEILESEHRIIEQVLNCLEKIALRAEHHGMVCDRDARDALDFLRHFADQCHHAKEEGHLFPLMEGHGFSREHGPTGVMLYEHNMGRAHVSAMFAALDQVAAGELQATKQFNRHAHAYIKLLREHIAKEDHCLFPMANETFAPHEQYRLAHAFEQIEGHVLGIGAHERYIDLANDLADRLNVPRAVLENGCQKPGCVGTVS